MKDLALPGIIVMLLGLALSAVIIGPATGQVTRRDIERIRSNDELTPDDQQRLESFIQLQYDQMRRAGEPTELNPLITELVEISGSALRNPLTQMEYSRIFAEIVQARYIDIYQMGVKLVGQPAEASQIMGFHLKLAAVLPLSASNHQVVIDDLLGLLQDQSAEVRSMAAKGLALKNIQDYLTHTDTPAVRKQQVLNDLDQCLVREDSPEVIMYIVSAVNLPINEGKAILSKCVDKRVEQYRVWEVTNEGADSEIMRQIFSAAQRELAANDRSSVTELLRDATKIYWAAYQRFSRGRAYQTEDKKVLPLLSERSELVLKAMLIDGEDSFRQICDSRQSSPRTRRQFETALQDQNATNLDVPYEALLGANGLVQEAFSIYNNWSAPAELPVPSAEVLKKAENLLKVKQNSIIGDSF